MNLTENVTIMYQGKRITKDMVDSYREKWKGYNRALACGNENFPEDEVLITMLAQSFRVDIVPEQNAEPLVLEASLRKFPYRVNGKRNDAHYGVRLVPIKGSVNVINSGDGGAGELVSASARSNMISFGFCLGNYLEVFFDPQIMPLGELMPPEWYREEVTI